jgi:hypothetical protein
MSWFSDLMGGGARRDNEAAQALAAKTAEDQRAAEAKRQADIRAGQAGIDTAFSQFDQPYYDKYKETYTGNYLPQIADQYATAKDKLTATLAGRGTLESTVGASKFGELDQTRGNAQADIGNQATDAANALKGKVEDAKTNLYTLNQSAADPTGVSAQAIGRATSIAAPSALSPLGQVFASTLNAFGTYNKADGQSMNPSLPWNKSAGYSAPLSGAGSSTMVR